MLAGFWGLVVDPSVSYSQISIDPKSTTEGERVSVSVQVSNSEYIIANLIPGKNETVIVDLTFSEGEEITFTSNGGGVHMTGNYIMDINEEDDEHDDHDHGLCGDDHDDEDEDDSEDEDEPAIFFDKDGDPVDAEGNKIDIEELMGDDDEDEDELDEEEFMEMMAQDNKKKPKIVELKDGEDGWEEVEDDSADVDMEEKEKPSKQEEKPEKAAEKPKTKAEKRKERKEKQKAKKEAPKEEVTKKPEVEKSEVKKSDVEKSEVKKPEVKKSEEAVKKTLASGLVIEDVKVGQGVQAKSGKKVSVRYIGKLASGKVFDSNTTGKPFSFKLGGGQVIKGWDIGVLGMSVGGTRNLTIPPALAYGARGAPPDIPKNATLQFEVKLLSVN